jgi:ABC-2 type transport system permease protein
MHAEIAPHRALPPAWWRARRIGALMRVEVLRLLRDRPTLALIVLVPVVQMLLFGGAVNLNPRGLVLAVAHPVGIDSSAVARAATATGYFSSRIVDLPAGEGLQALATGVAQVAVEWNGLDPLQILVEASDPAAVRPATLALAAALQLQATALLAGSAGPGSEWRRLTPTAPHIEWLYNPEASTAWGITPGLVGVVVMITTLLLGALTLVREREQGSWESLLATAADGIDALVGKLSPYVLLGVLQAAIVVACAYYFFGVPVRGPLWPLLLAAMLLALAHLLFGFALSALAATQLQAVQSAVFFYLPSMLLSGFMFPFAGMPAWARAIGECIPLTHFVRVARGVMLRGAQPGWVIQEMWPVALFVVIAAALALSAYRRHLN